jgi:acyl-CoA synthetase (AMP-forming)/AMP-acid ligase II
MSQFSVPDFCQVVQDHKVTYAYVAPPIVLHLAKNPVVSDYDLSSLRFLTSGAAPLTKELILAVHDRLKLPVKQAYGLSETSPVCHMQPWNADWKTRMGSVGPLLNNLEARYIGPDEKDVQPGKEGEVWLRGPTIFKGYHGNAEATKNSITEDGWFKTGDVGFEDSDGHLYITDRVKELIKYKGSQVAPAELEGLLHSHELVDDVAVLGRYVDSIASEVPMAFVVTKSPSSARPEREQQAEAIIGWLRGKTAKTKWLRGGIVFVEEVPKSASGKILRRVLKDRLKEDKEIEILGERLHAGEAKL